MNTICETPQIYFIISWKIITYIHALLPNWTSYFNLLLQCKIVARPKLNDVFPYVHSSQGVISKSQPATGNIFAPPLTSAEIQARYKNGYRHHHTQLYYLNAADKWGNKLIRSSLIASKDLLRYRGDIIGSCSHTRVAHKKRNYTKIGGII